MLGFFILNALTS